MTAHEAIRAASNGEGPFPSVQTISAVDAGISLAVMGSGTGGGGTKPGGSNPPSSPKGSSWSDPIMLEVNRNTPYTGTKNYVWYKYTVSGSHDIYVDAPGAYIKMYGNFNNAPGTDPEHLASDLMDRVETQVSSASHWIKIESRTSSAVKYSVSVKQHQDSMICPAGDYWIRWYPTDAGCIDKGVIPSEMYFFPASMIESLIAIVDDDPSLSFVSTYYDCVDYMASEDFSAFCIKYPIIISLIKIAIRALFQATYPETAIAVVDRIRNSLEKYPKGVQAYRKGVMILTGAQVQYEINSWDCSTARGPLGTAGSFEIITE